MSAGALYISIRGDTTDLKKALVSAGVATEKSTKKMSKSFDGIKNSLFNLRNAIIGLGVAWSGREILQIADQYTLLESRLKLVTKSAEETAEVQIRLLEIANESRTTYAGVLDNYTRMARATEELGTSSTDLLRVTETLAKAITVSGARSEEASAALIQFSQGLASSRLSGDELRSVLEQIPAVAKLIADGLGIAIGQMREWGEQGKLTTDVVLGALLAGGEKIDRQFAQITVTVGQSIVVLQNMFKDVVYGAARASGGTNDMATAIMELAETVKDNREDIISLFSRLLKGAASGVASIGEMSEKLTSLASELERVYDSLPPWIWKVGIIGALVGGVTGKVALGAIATIAKVTEKAKAYRIALEDIIALENDAKTARTMQTLASDEEELHVIDQFNRGLRVQIQAGEEYIDMWQKYGVVAPKAIKAAAEETKKYTKGELKAFVQAGKDIEDTWLAFDKGKDEARMRGIQMVGEIDLIDKIVANEQAFMEFAATVEAETEEVTAASAKLWEDFVSSTGYIINDFISDTLHGQFESIEEMFKGLLDSMLDMLISFVARAAANSLINAIFGAGAAGSGALTLGSLFSGAGTALGIGGAGAVVAGAAGNVVAVGGAGAAGGAGYMIGTGSGAFGTYPATGGAVGSASAGLSSSAIASIGAASAAAAWVTLGPKISHLLFGTSEPFDKELTEGGVTGGSLTAAGVTDTILNVKESIDTSFVPALNRAEFASYDAASGLLVVGNSFTEVVGSYEQGTDKMIESVNATVFAFDKATGAWVETGISIDELATELKKLTVETGGSIEANARLIAQQAGVPSLVDEIITAYRDLASASAYAASAVGSSASQVRNTNWGVRPQGQFHDGGTVPYDGTFYLQKGEVVVPEKGGNSAPPTTINFVLDGEIIDSRILEVVDGHIVERNARGLTTERVY